MEWSYNSSHRSKTKLQVAWLFVCSSFFIFSSFICVLLGVFSFVSGAVHNFTMALHWLVAFSADPRSILCFHPIYSIAVLLPAWFLWNEREKLIMINAHNIITLSTVLPSFPHKKEGILCQLKPKKMRNWPGRKTPTKFFDKLPVGNKYNFK